MCGIAGLLSGSKVDEALVRRMTARIAHRGPDDAGVWIDQEAGVGLGHRRLSIVDLSPSGHQPMVSSDGRWVLDYNGEIYNHARDARGARRRPARPGEQWHSVARAQRHRDADRGIAAWGLDRALEQAVGMFAFALWDRKERKLHLVRDRFGEKPLYYGWAAGSFVFASELKAIRALRRLRQSRSTAARCRLLAARTYIPAPLSIYQRLFKLRAGLHPDRDADAFRHRARRRRRRHVGRHRPRLLVVSPDASSTASPTRSPTRRRRSNGSRTACPTAIQGQSVADVPVGAFLSGGIDSSTVVALYQKHSTGRCGPSPSASRKPGSTRRDYAKLVAAHLGTEHNEQYVTRRGSAGSHPAAPGDVRRAVRRSLANPDPSRQPLRPRAGHGRPVRRRRRRIVRRLQPLFRHAARCGAAFAGLPRPVRRGAGARARLGPASGLERGGPAVARRGAASISAPRCTRLSHHGATRDGLRRLSSAASSTNGRAAIAGDRRRRRRWPSAPTSTALRRRARHDAHDVLRRDVLFARRHPVQGRPRGDGGQPRDPRAVPRSPRRRGRRAHSR